MSEKKKIFKWNHISEDLPPDEITKLQNLYKHYHTFQMLSLEI